jgi:hypothetical protein
MSICSEIHPLSFQWKRSVNHGIAFVSGFVVSGESEHGNEKEARYQKGPQEKDWPA